MKTNQMKFIQTNDKGFYLMPMTKDCLFVQAIYNNNEKIMTVYSTLTHEMFDLIPTFSRSGKPIMTRTEDGNTVTAKERQLVHVPYEYTLSNKEEIKTFITEMCGDVPDIDKFLE